MVALVDERGVEAQDWGSCPEEFMQSYFTAVTFSQGLVLHRQFSSRQILESLASLFVLVSYGNIGLAILVVGDFIKRGGREHMHKSL